MGSERGKQREKEIYIHIYTYIHTYIHIFIKRKRERERETETTRESQGSFATFPASRRKATHNEPTTEVALQWRSMTMY